eukprot:TRINITY_DN2866_c5_g1_i1.p1 TRINITY_DN2866_c5_g1~~TRINITY_DN2866_c5_g1_i1.p1  ORF type:complete len:682 (+),score=166.21 TRINITY_DN2866_c5_g1_i1:79-2124(+)
MGVHLGCFRRWLRWDTDDLAERTRKAVCIPMYSGALVLALVAIAQSAQQDGLLTTFTYGAALVAVASACLLTNLVITRSIPLLIVEVTTPAVTAGILFIDWFNAAVPGKARTWSLTVLVMDALLVVGGRRSVQGICLHGIAVWLVVSAAEDSYRLGLYDIEHWSQPPEALLRDHLSCTDPPCAVGWLTALGNLLQYVAVLYLDFIATRTFAEGMRTETERVRAMVCTAELVADCLARFDLQAAEEVLERDAGGITADLTVSFRHLLGNLASYKPYLPQSCFEDTGCADSSTRPSPQGTPQEPPSRPDGGAADAAGSLDFQLQRDDTLLDRAETARTSGVLADVRSVSSASAISPRAHGRAPLTGARIGHAPRQRRVAILLTNRVGMLGALAQSTPASLAHWLLSEVAQFCEAVQHQKGVVDALSADHMRAFFGALGAQQSSTRSSAARCAATITGMCRERQEQQPTERLELAESLISEPLDEPGDCFRRLPRTSAICGGQAMCGDFGSSDAQRFMVVGAVAAFAAVVERAAAAWGISVLLDTDICDEVKTSWNCRLRKMVRFAKHRQSNPTGLWEVVAEKPDRRSSQGEWMYQLAVLAADPWEQYNGAVQLWCRGDYAGALGLVGPDIGSSSVPIEEDVQQAKAALGDALRQQLPPPLCVVPPGAGLGAPSLLTADVALSQ